LASHRNYTWARCFSAQLGRFCSRDPLLFKAGDFNLYRYVLNNPITGTDSSGLAAQYYCADPGYQGIGTMGRMIEQWEHEVAVAKAKQLCANVDYCSDGCKNKGCTEESCVAAMTTFVEAVNDTWILPSGWNRCSRWVLDLNSRIPDDFGKNPCISWYNLEEHDMYAYGGATRVHWTFYVKLCDGTKINADEGAWGGSDHLF